MSSDKPQTIAGEKLPEKQQVSAGSESASYKLSRRRWFILFGMCLFGYLNGLVSILDWAMSRAN